MGIAAERTVTLHAGRYGVTVAPAASRRGAGVVAVVHTFR
jgi:hypothetical protein